VVTDSGDGNAYDHADWAAAKLTCGSDSVAPTLVSKTPASGATGVASSTTVTATFSEDMQTASLTAATITLVRQSTGTAVTASVAYNAATLTATLTPSAALAASSLYTATVKGGAGGVKDVAGNPLAADVVWTFTTSAGPVTTFLGDLTPTSSVSGWGPAEKDKSNGEQAAGDGVTITLNGTTYAKGIGAHAASDIRYVATGCSVFTSDVGVDDEVGANGSVVFQVWVDGVQKYDSGVMTGATATKTASVTLSGNTELRLVITDGGDGNAYDHADWASARITCGS